MIIIVVAQKMGIWVEWINQVIRSIGVRGDHFELLHKARLSRIQLEELQKQMGRAGQRLVELDIQMSHKNFSSDLNENNKIQVVKENE